MPHIFSFSFQRELADNHWQQVDNPNVACPELWLHYSIAALETIPLVGALAALIELVARCVYNYFQGPAPAAPAPVVVPPAVPVVAPAPAPAPLPILLAAVPAAPAPLPLPPAVPVAPPAPAAVVNLAPFEYVYRENPPVTTEELEALHPAPNFNVVNQQGHTPLYQALRTLQFNPELVRHLVKVDAHYTPGSSTVPEGEVTKLLEECQNVSQLVVAHLDLKRDTRLFISLKTYVLTQPDGHTRTTMRSAASILKSFEEHRDSWDFVYATFLTFSRDVAWLVTGYFGDVFITRKMLDLLPAFSAEERQQVSTVYEQLRHH